MNAMITRHAFMRGPRLRAALHLAAVLLILAGMDVVAARSASAAAARKTAARSESHKRTSASHRKTSESHKKPSASHKKSSEKVNINTAPLGDLEELPGVGTVIAQKIMAGRPYKSVQELRRAGVPPATVRGLLGVVTTGRAAEAPQPSSAGAPEAQVAVAKRSAAPSARSSPAQRTFFGIPIGRPRQPAAKAESAPVARGNDRARSAKAPEASVRFQGAEPPAEGMVWVDHDSRAFYYKGDHRYGTTRHGQFLWEDQAVRDGYRAPKAAPRRSK